MEKSVHIFIDREQKIDIKQYFGNQQGSVSLLKIYQKIHKAGFIYNNLKPENILFDYGAHLDSDLGIHLINFRHATQYIKYGSHIEKHSITSFQGNCAFASIGQLEDQASSQRDDLISLVYLLKGQMFLNIDYNQITDKQIQIQIIKRAKKSINVERLCSGEAKCLREFAKTVFEMKFKQRPEYDKLQKIID